MPEGQNHSQNLTFSQNAKHGINKTTATMKLLPYSPCMPDTYHIILLTAGPATLSALFIVNGETLHHITWEDTLDNPFLKYWLIRLVRDFEVFITAYVSVVQNGWQQFVLIIYVLSKQNDWFFFYSIGILCELGWYSSTHKRCNSTPRN